MRLLILGSTALLGRAVLEQAAESGHDVVVLNRTVLDRQRLTRVQWIDGSTETDIYKLGGQTFDAVIDFSASLSEVTLRNALAFADRVGLYVLVSSISAYRDFAATDIGETYPTAAYPAGIEERADDYSTYPGRMALCEARVAEVMRSKTLIVRAGLVSGPYDCSDRVPRLLRRFMAGGEMIAGGSASQPVQILDVRDLATFLLDRAEAQRPGLYNATGISQPLEDVMDAVGIAAGMRPELHYPGDDVLARAGVQPMSQLPLWCPERGYPGYFRINSDRAYGLGLATRPLVDTFSAAMAWMKDQELRGSTVRTPPGGKPPTATLPRSVEQRIIDDIKRASNGRHVPAMA